MKTHSLALALVLSCAAFGCDNPTADKPKAEVGSAKPASTADAKGAAYELKADGSKFEFGGSKVTGSHPGGFKKFTGSATLAGDAIEGSKVTVEIDMDSVYSDSEKLTGHLKNDDFFMVAKFPMSKFESTEVKKGGADGASHTITGNLTMRGVSKSITFPAKIAKSGDSLTVNAEFAINRKDFGIAYAGKKDDLIKDDVLIKLDLKLGKKG